MRKTLLTLLACLTVLTVFNGCAHKITLHPVTDQDIRILQDGSKEWVCMSPDYVKEVMRARLGK